MTDKCSTCEHKSQGIFDFPRILIVQFNRKQFPELIGSAKGSFWEETQENLKMLEESTSPDFIAKLKSSSGEKLPFKPVMKRERDYRYGYIFYKDTDKGKKGYVQLANVTDAVHQLLQLPRIDNYLKSLEALVGIETTPEILRISTENSQYYKDGIELNELEIKDGHRACEIRLIGEYWDYGPFAIPLVNTDIATFKYEGRLND